MFELSGLNRVINSLNSSQDALITTLDIYNEALKQLKTESAGKEAIAWMPSPKEIWKRMEVIRKALAAGELPPPETSKFETALQKIGTYVGMVTSQWDAMWNQMYQNQITRIDNEHQARKQAIDDSMMSDQEKYFAIEKLDREMQKKRLAAMRKQAVATKVSSIIEATINTAVAFTAALKAGGFIGIILAGIVAAMGAAQIALIAAQPLPSFAEGGIALTPQVATVAERGPEAIAPLGDLISIIRETIRSELETSPTAGRSQVLRLHQDVYIGGDRVEEKVTEIVMHKAEVGDLTFPAKVIR